MSYTAQLRNGKKYKTDTKRVLCPTRIMKNTTTKEFRIETQTWGPLNVVMFETKRTDGGIMKYATLNYDGGKFFDVIGHDDQKTLNMLSADLIDLPELEKRLDEVHDELPF